MSSSSDVRNSEALRRIPTVRDMMARDFISVRPEASIGEVAKTLVRRRVFGAAVVDADGCFHGYVSTRGVLAALAEFLHDERPVGPLLEYLDLVSPRLSEEASLMAAIHRFEEAGHNVLALPVLRGDELVGVVTRLDVLRAVMDHLGGAKGTGPETLYISALKKSDEGPSY
jgi:CBS domain-containing protein